MKSFCRRCGKNLGADVILTWNDGLCSECAAEFEERVLDLSVANQIESLSDMEYSYWCFSIGLDFLIDSEIVSDCVAEISTSENENDYNSLIEE